MQHQDHQGPGLNANPNKTKTQTKPFCPKQNTLSQQQLKETTNCETSTYAQAKTNLNPLKKPKVKEKTHTSYPI